MTRKLRVFPLVFCLAGTSLVFAQAQPIEKESTNVRGPLEKMPVSLEVRLALSALPPKTPWPGWPGYSASPIRSRSWAARKQPERSASKAARKSHNENHLRSRVATQPYKITFKDGSTQTLPRVWRHYRDGPFLVFQDEDTEVLRVSAADVSSVVRTEMPDEERT